VYTLLIITRSPIFDRYFLPLQLVFTLVLVRVYWQTISERLPKLCFMGVLLFAAYGVASTHDLFAYDRARLKAANEISAAGVPRTAIEGGFEYDGWTQLEQTGYVNHPEIAPADLYHPWVPPDISPSCLGWFRQYTPSIHPPFHLWFTPGRCYRQSHFAPIVYETWLPPGKQTIYILENR
ncbi:MAG: hypothetical protein ACRD3K_05095, partial [Edaphobacter sp.]